MAGMAKVLTMGARVRVEGLPSRSILEEAAPADLLAALAALDEANEASAEAAAAHAAARKARRLEEVPSRIPALEDEAHEAEGVARERLQAARRAAGVVARLFEEHAEEIAVERARRRVRAFVEACDAVPVVAGFLGYGGSGSVRPDLAPSADPRVAARPDVGTVRRALVETDARGLLERARMTPEDAGLVEVVGRQEGRVLVTPSLAASLVAGSGSWSFPAEEG